MDKKIEPKFSGIQNAADAAMTAPIAPAAPSAAAAAPTTPAEAVVASKHPLYDAQDGEDGDTGHAQLMHDLGKALQEIMAKDPDTNKSMSDLMEEFLGKGVDYEKESKRLRGLIESRKTPKAPNWIAAGVGSWAGGPEVASRFRQMQDAATGGERQKQQDIEDMETSLLKAHTEDLRTRGKHKEALLMGLMTGAMAQKRTETQEAGKTKRAEDAAALRLELQERSLGAAAERVRMQISGRRDVADKDRAAGQVMHLYESLLKQTEKDVTGAVRPIYTADEAMDLALNSILPKVAPGVKTMKTGVAPTKPAGQAAAPAPTGQSKFAQWKAQQAAKKTAGN